MRLDIYLVEKGLAESREKAKYLIREGYVSIDRKIIKKPSKQIKGTPKPSISKEFEFVGRGGYKIDNAVRHFGVDFNGKIIADVGCSTGGFTHYALKHGAEKVHAVDSGNPLHESLRQDSRVNYIPNKDARTIKQLEEQVDLCLIDVTFSPLEEILSVVKNWLKPNGEILGLIKPPFETRGRLRKIKNHSECQKIAENVADWASENGYKVEGIIESALKGKTSKQTEFFIYLKRK